MSSPWSAGSEMLSNAEYIQKELPKLFLSDELRAQVLKVCKSWEATYFDLLDDETPFAVAERYVSDDIAKADVVVRALDAASKEDPRYGSAYILVSESTANVMKAFGAPSAQAPPAARPALSEQAASSEPAQPPAPSEGTFHQRLMQAMISNLNQASTASSQPAAPPTSHWSDQMAQAMVDNLNARVLAEKPPPNAEDLKVTHQQRRLAGIKPGVSWHAPAVSPEERASLLAQAKEWELSQKKPEVHTSGPHRQSTGDFWREQRANGFTDAEGKAMLDSLPPIVPVSSQVIAPIPAKPSSYWTRAAALIRAVRKNLRRSTS